MRRKINLNGTGNNTVYLKTLQSGNKTLVYKDANGREHEVGSNSIVHKKVIDYISLQNASREQLSNTTIIEDGESEGGNL